MAQLNVYFIPSDNSFSTVYNARITARGIYDYWIKGKLGTDYKFYSPKWSTSSTYCSKFAWEAHEFQFPMNPFMHTYMDTVDFDSNGGWWVTPDNIKNSSWTFYSNRTK